MKLENQVSPLDKAKRLKELGVLQDSYFCYSGPKETYYNGEGEPPITIIRSLGLYGFYSEYNYYSAYTVAELGAMMPDLFAIDEKFSDFYDEYFKEIPKSERESKFFSMFLTADFLSSLLIYLIEKGYNTIDEVNHRLKEEK